MVSSVSCQVRPEEVCDENEGHICYPCVYEKKETYAIQEIVRTKTQNKGKVVPVLFF
jgi:hypothetical protein